MVALKGTTSKFFELEASDRGPALSLADLGATGEARAGNTRFVCPLCDSTRKKKNTKQLSVNMATGAWHCWHCDAKGKLTDYWTERPKLTRKERTRDRLRRAFSITSHREPEPSPDDAEWRQWLTASVPLAGTPGETYLAGRGIPRDLAETNGVTFIRSWYGRPGVVYPLRDSAGQLAAAGVRYTDGRMDPKTRVGGKLGLGAFTTPGVFMGDTVILVEGPADALSLALCGVSAVALHRTSAPDWVIKKCAFKRVLVALDADAAGDEKSPLLTMALESFGAKPERMRPPLPKDWNDALVEWGTDRLREWLFVRLVADSWKRVRARSLTWPVHAELEAAIATSDWPAYQRELPRYERGAVLPGDYCPDCRTAMSGRQCWTCDYALCAVCGERTEYATHPTHRTCTATLPTDAPAVLSALIECGSTGPACADDMA